MDNIKIPPVPAPLHAAPLAYENPGFLDSDDGRALRILSEYQEPLVRFRRERIADTVVFFGSARIRSLEAASRALHMLNQPAAQSSMKPEQQRATTSQQPDGETGSPETSLVHTAIAMARYYEDARRLAGMVASWSMQIPGPRHRFVVTSGGGPGIMEAANRGAYEVGAKTIGLNIQLPFEQNPNPYITPALNFEFHYFFMRKYWFAYLAKALIVFPGGFGTMDEMFEVLTLAQTKKLEQAIPVILYGSDYWKRVLNLEVLAENGAIAPKDLDLFQFADTPEDAFALLCRGLEPFIDPREPDGEQPIPAQPQLTAQQTLGPNMNRTRKLGSSARDKGRNTDTNGSDG